MVLHHGSSGNAYGEWFSFIAVLDCRDSIVYSTMFFFINIVVEGENTYGMFALYIMKM